MGQGGQFQFLNSTPNDWVKTAEHSYQMNNWSLPNRIPAWSRQQVYVEWSQGIFETWGDDGADTTYSIEGTGSTFTLGARGRPGFHLFAQMGDVQYNLGWNHDGTTTFALAGNSGVWSWSGMNGSSWMRDNLSLLGTRTLREIAITGSHDSGMSTNSSGGTAFANPANTITQALPVGVQLAKGARYFDIRPVITAGQFATGHYGDVGGAIGWQGQNGQSIQSIIDEINAFTNQQTELIILNLSHSLNTDVGRDYRPFDQSEWNRLFQQLEGLQKRYSSTVSDLTTLPLSNFIGGGSAAVLIIVEESAELGSRPGFFTAGSFPVYNSYADSNDLDNMASDQFGKMATETQKGTYFLLSWTLTQSGFQAFNGTPSILDLARVANDALVSRLLGQDHAGFPNIIYTDYILDARSVVAAMSLNCQRWLKT